MLKNSEDTVVVAAEDAAESATADANAAEVVGTADTEEVAEDAAEGSEDAVAFATDAADKELNI